MSIVDEVQEALSEANPVGKMSDGLRRLSEFNEEMKRRGIVKKREYNLPLIDTIGRSGNIWKKAPKE